MKKILLLFLIALAVGCSETELKSPAPVIEYDVVDLTHYNKGTGQKNTSTLVDVCESKHWHNNLYGTTFPVSYMTPMTMALSNDTGDPAKKIKKFTHTVLFTNNTNNTIRLYKDGVAKGLINPYGSRGILFIDNCTCADGTCQSSYLVYYNWTIEYVSGDAVANVTVTSSTNNGHTIDSPNCQIAFQ